MIKGLVFACLVAVAMADAEADAHYGYFGYGLVPTVPAVYNSYPNWPGISTPFGSSTCFGCRGKRSADPHYAFAPYPYFFPAAAVSGSADGSSYAVSQGHPGFASSFQSVNRGKRSAEADADAHYGAFYAFNPYAVSGYGINQAHPSGSSYQHVSRGYPIYGWGK